MEAVVGFLTAKLTSSWRRRTRVRVAQTKVARLPKVELQNVTDLADRSTGKSRKLGISHGCKSFCSM